MKIRGRADLTEVSSQESKDYYVYASVAVHDSYKVQMDFNRSSSLFYSINNNSKPLMIMINTTDSVCLWFVNYRHFNQWLISSRGYYGEDLSFDC